MKRAWAGLPATEKDPKKPLFQALKLMSPEQASGEVEDVGPSSDVYNLGATLYHILTGKPPRSGGNVEEIVKQAEDGKFPAPRSIRPEIPRSLEAICLRAMSPKPRDRYRSSELLAADIERHLAGETVSVYQEPASQRLNRWIQAHRTLVATSMAATLLLMSAALLALIFWQRSRERDFQRQLGEGPDEKAAIQEIEADEWQHRDVVRGIMRKHEIRVSKYYEMKYHVIGKLISFSCHLIGWFMPFYFAGRLESGNVCEYFRMMHYFDELGINEHHQALYEMGVKEKEHEEYFLRKLKTHRMLPPLEKLFAWGKHSSLNDVDLNAKYSVAESKKYCRKHDGSRPR